jgi:hypothetical protein
MEAKQSAHEVEIVLDSFRVKGDLVAPGGPRRLVDILNAHDETFLLVRDAVIDDPITVVDTPKRSTVVQVLENSILFALPLGDDVLHEDPFETVRKVPTECTIVLPGYEINGRIHMIEEVVPAETPLLGAKHFMAITNAEIVSLFNRTQTWHAEVVVVNLMRAVLFAADPKAVAAAAEAA